ncbi:MAG: hypothetical protein JXA30_01110 [Deltaproteobacteria bacterium]|nr:hypothetical protein [Deltaproteobacteria bacterium]
MLRNLLTFCVLGVCVASIPAAAQESIDAYLAEEYQSAPENTGTPAGQETDPADTTLPPEPPSAEPSPAAPPPATEAERDGLLEGWHVELTGYFRAPLALGISSRPGPDTYNPETEELEGSKKMQVSYGPNRTVDSSYYSFAYTRLQEQDWVEVYVHAKKKHVDAAVGWLGYWLAAAGYRNYDASWAPAMAYLTLDTDVELDPGFKPNVALTVGAFWPRFGSFPKYDTYMLGQFRHVGEQIKLTLPINPDLTVAIVQGFGTGRDGSFNIQVNPLYAGKTGVDLLHYYNIQLTYKKYLDIGLHYNNEWTTDATLWEQAQLGSGKSYTEDISKAHLSVVGVELGLSAPYAGRLWFSPSYISVKNGWAIPQGTEVMHSLGGAGIATNYMAWSKSPPDSTGTGSMFNVGFLYENTLSGIQGKEPTSALPEVTLNLFGLFTEARRDLPEGTTISQDGVKQFKYGADVTVQPLTWLAFMLRYDEVDYDLDNPGYVFSVITPRLVFCSHFLSGESIYIQYSRYFYGDKMVLAAEWPWGTPLMAGGDIIQGGRYSGSKPDEDVVKLQASVAF